MGRRVLAFFLGMIFGIIFFLGSIAGGIVILATVVHPNEISYDLQKFLGDLGDKSLWEIYKEVGTLYNDKLGITDENGKYFTLGEFCTKYNINANELFGGKQVPDEVLDVPVFELIGGNRDDALKQIKVSVVPALLNVFLGGGTNEDGSTNALFPDSLLEKLSAHSITRLFEEGGLSEVFADVRIAEVAMGMLPLERTKDDELISGDNALLWAVGQSKLGPILGGMDGNIFLQFKTGGAFETLGIIPLVDILGDNSQYLNAFIKDYAIADLIDDEGNINPDDILNGVYLGDIVSLHRKAETLDGYSATQLSNDDYTLWQNSETNGLALVGKEDEAYQAQLVCRKEEHVHNSDCPKDGEGNYICDKEEHTHTIDCYGFVWYDAEDNQSNGIYGAIADVTIGMLTSGNQDALVNKFMNIPIRDIIGDSVEISGLLQNFVDYTVGELMSGDVFEDLYLGQLLGLTRVEADGSQYTPAFGLQDVGQRTEGDEVFYAKRADDVWYEAKLTCKNQEEDHTHTADCFGFVWKTESDEDSSGIYSALADITVGELMGGDSTVLIDKLVDIPLRELLQGQEISGIFDNIADMTIGELINGGIDNMYLGQLLGYTREEIEKPSGDVTELYKTEPHDGEEVALYLVKSADGTIALSEDGNVWYKGEITCKEDHEHNLSGCYAFVWKDDDTVATGLMGKLANKKIADLSDLDQMIKELTLYDVLGEDIPAMLKSLKDVTIGELDTAIDELYLGELLEYTRRETDSEGYTALGDTTDVMYKNVSAEDGDVVYIKNDKGVWYEALLKCVVEEHTHTEDCTGDGGEYVCGKEEHTHGSDCFFFEWYKVCDDAHDHADEWLNGETYYVPADGMMLKLGNEKVHNLGNLNETVQTFTLYDVLGENVPSMLKSIQHTQINGIEQAINDVYLGDFLGYTMGEMQPDGTYLWTKEDGTPVEGMMAKLANQKVKELGDLDATVKTFTLKDVLGEDVPSVLNSLADTQIGELNEAIDEMYLGDFLGYTMGEETEEGSGKYLWTTEEGAPVEGMMAKLANEKVKDLGNLDKTVQTFTLRDVMGENVPVALSSLADTELHDLGKAVDEMYLGSFLQFKRKPIENSEMASYSPTSVDGVKSRDTGTGIVYAMQDGDNWFEAVNLCGQEEHTHSLDSCSKDESGNWTCGQTPHTHEPSCFGIQWYEACNTEHSHEGEWKPSDSDNYYIPSNSLLGRLSRLHVNELNSTNIKDTVNDTALGEVLDLDTANGLLKELSAVKIGKLGKELDAIYVGIAMGYKRQEATRHGGDGWEKVAEDANKEHNRHDEVYKDDKGNYYIHDKKHDLYYDAQLICSDTHDHVFTCYGYIWFDCRHETVAPDHVHGQEGDASCTRVKGLNEKVSNLRIDELNGRRMTEIATNLTMGDLLDSDMVKLGETTPEIEENEYKLAILCCRHSGDGNDCSLAGFMLAKATQRTLTAKDYFNQHHASMGDDEKETHHNNWRDIELSKFITDILSAL